MAENQRRRGFAQAPPKLFRAIQQCADKLAARLPEEGERGLLTIVERARADVCIQSPDYSGPLGCEGLAPHDADDVGRDDGVVDPPQQHAVVDPLLWRHPALLAGGPGDEWVQNERVARGLRPRCSGCG